MWISGSRVSESAPPGFAQDHGRLVDLQPVGVGGCQVQHLGRTVALQSTSKSVNMVAL